MKWALALLSGYSLTVLAAPPFEDETLARHMALLGDGVVQQAITAPVIREPARWVSGPAGDYHYRYVAGKDEGAGEQLQRHTPDPARPALAWTRHVGESLIEGVEVVDGQAIRLHTETDLEHGYRVEFRSRVTLPANTRVGDTWASASELALFALDEPDTVAHTGTLEAQHRYVGAYRVVVPAGAFDAVLLEEDYRIEVGLLTAEDRRYVFYARDVGVVAEVEGLRASALLVLNTHEESVKVLSDYPGAPPAGH